MWLFNFRDRIDWYETIPNVNDEELPSEYWPIEGDGTGYQELHGYSSSYRSNTRRIIYYDNLKNLLWERVHSFLTTKLSHKTLQSNWNAYGLNPQFRFCRYLPGQKFAAHYDGNFVLNSGNRSFYTFMIYLNGGFEGGATRFLDSKTQNTIVSLDPEPGLLLVFQHNIYHDGEELRSGAKYMMRSDVMFELETISADETAEAVKLQEAHELLNRAEQFEGQGKHAQAIECYKKAYKLAPELEKKDYESIEAVTTPSAKPQVASNTETSTPAASTAQWWGGKIQKC